ncbi:VOC family protein [Chitinophagaceae bacterium 26-R-25]|nr:VOC family protein [Chitinophagaceae bacterium 26-R-25]
MQKITPFLWYDNNAEEAMNLYTSIFKNTSIRNKRYYGKGGPGPEGQLMTAIFSIDGQDFMVLNGGPMFKFTEAFSLFVLCDTQEEIDEKWDKLIANGGEPSRCGWLKDKFGLSWQIIPRVLNEILGDPDPAKARRGMEAMMKMAKLNIKELEDARDGEGN